MLIYVLRWRPSWIFDRHKKYNICRELPMIIPGQFGFNCPCGFREEAFWDIFPIGSNVKLSPAVAAIFHVEYPTGTKNSNFVEDHPRNIPAKFGSNWPSGFGEEACNVKSLQTADNRCQVMAIVHLDLWSRWTKKMFYSNSHFPLVVDLYRSLQKRKNL